MNGKVSERLREWHEISENVRLQKDANLLALYSLIRLAFLSKVNAARCVEYGSPRQWIYPMCWPDEPLRKADREKRSPLLRFGEGFFGRAKSRVDYFPLAA